MAKSPTILDVLPDPDELEDDGLSVEPTFFHIAGQCLDPENVLQMDMADVSELKDHEILKLLKYVEAMEGPLETMKEKLLVLIGEGSDADDTEESQIVAEKVEESQADKTDRELSQLLYELDESRMEDLMERGGNGETLSNEEQRELAGLLEKYGYSDRPEKADHALSD